jgi:hypothetical protein
MARCTFTNRTNIRYDILCAWPICDTDQADYYPFFSLTLSTTVLPAAMAATIGSNASETG